MELTVLIIDDNDDEILMTKFILGKINRNIRTHTALSGEAGLALLHGLTAPPSLILLDLKMPKLDGIEVLRIMQEDEHLRRIPVVIFTHSKLESDEQLAVKAGACSFLHKSTDLDQYRQDLERILGCRLQTNVATPMTKSTLCNVSA
jgi:two-component system, response regulator